ncbi:hypothetical protein DKM44_04140 [Deinococcus irradiatisoli]|uniref:Uncharacterized protein n=1 Tax=Deinococcus irradiatisoli TaxID=2202254 RepID=A0A2Z3JC38_9DEIO|nr:hypothetical protein [Deinococcus irradiatisoli]AWN22525.1 hypothetical protein DKM44_04140 [Deinococcus irradiatisoli]
MSDDTLKDTTPLAGISDDTETSSESDGLRSGPSLSPVPDLYPEANRQRQEGDDAGRPGLLGDDLTRRRNPDAEGDTSESSEA